MSTTIDEIGTVTYHENPFKSFSLEHLRHNFRRIDEDIGAKDLHWERIAASGWACTWSGFPPPFPADPIFVHMALALKEDQEPTKEQIFIIDHFTHLCSKALGAFQRDGSFPDEKIRQYFEKEQSNT